MMPPPFVHDVVMREEDDFEPRFTTHEDLAGADLLLREENELLRVKLLVRPHSVPPRRRRPPARRLARGEWLRWQVNYRFSGYSLDWTYRLDTLNVGYGPAREDLFLGDPTHHVDERGTLR
ncbi:hypothetical protein EV193_105201 [Herbihabitans rhizosphaerae]|uniref:Uncharacterized protein n=2 Tax=Herbihabitans rhizosphaerae TaxID=1872711 RepID=A0A4V2ESI0_9PSEU|nr:hypothetical protein EV193_105201 [Herbihabitans rhizosphaerae]